MLSQPPAQGGRGTIARPATRRRLPNEPALIGKATEVAKSGDEVQMTCKAQVCVVSQAIAVVRAHGIPRDETCTHDETHDEKNDAIA
jgi:hypothetical protein